MKTISRYIMTLALLITAVGGAWADGDTKYNVTFKANGNTKTVENVTLPKTFSCNVDDETGRGTDELDVIIQELYGLSGNYCLNTAPNSDNASVTCGMDDADLQYIIVNAPFNGTATVTGKYIDTNYSVFDYSLEITLAEAPIEVTTNAASKQDLFTTASFKMPTFDVDVNYELVRDMQDEANPVAFSGLPSSGNIVVKKGSDGKYQPAEALTIQLIDPLAAAEAQNIIAADGITVKVLVGDDSSLPIEYDHVSPITLEAFLADMKPGYYWIKAEPTDENSPYDGTVYSQEFLVSNGYELTIAAGEYATFYHNEKLHVDDEDAVLYTIASVTDTEAVLSSAIEVAPAETPLLVYNKSEQDKTFLLIPTTDDADEVTPATQFVGTLEATTIPASATGADNYALNGYAFVWVKNEIAVAANKCWLHIASQPAAARAMTRSITGGNGTTGIESIHNSQSTIDNEGWYDMQGRKLQSAPNRKGIYIHNGKKVIVR